MQTLPSFNALRAFEAAVRRGSFSAAANELHLTPSAVSHQVKLLEDQLGIQLFRRIGRSVVPTDRGARYYREIAAAFGRIKVATVDLTGDGMSDRLSVHSAPSFATQVLLPTCPSSSPLTPSWTSSSGPPRRPMTPWPTSMTSTYSTAGG